MVKSKSSQLRCRGAAARTEGRGAKSPPTLRVPPGGSTARPGSGASSIPRGVRVACRARLLSLRVFFHLGLLSLVHFARLSDGRDGAARPRVGA